MEKKYLYRYDRKYNYSNIGYIGELKITIELSEFEIKKTTPCGFFIEKDYPWQKGRFVLKGDGKRYAYETKEAAMDSFKKRTWKSYHFALRDFNNAKKLLQMLGEEVK